jgi:hypothetical protein
MSKGTIKMIRDNESGMIADSGGLEIPFNQPFLKELGLEVGIKVKYESVLIDGKPGGTSVLPLAKGKIITIKEGGDGSIMDKATGREINFKQPFIDQLDIVVDSKVNFEKITLPDGTVMAVALSLSASAQV